MWNRIFKEICPNYVSGLKDFQQIAQSWSQHQSVIIFLISSLFIEDMSVCFYRCAVCACCDLLAFFPFIIGALSISISTMLRCSSRAQHGAMRRPTCISSDRQIHKWGWAWEPNTCLYLHTITAGTDCCTAGCILLLVSLYMSWLQ